MTGRGRTATRPWLTLGCWLAAIALLGAIGSGVAGRLSATSLLVPGSPAAKAHAMLERQFGTSVPVTVLLQGPAPVLDRQGPRLVAAFRHERGVQVMSPWDRSADLRVLRPRPGAALIVAGFRRQTSEAMSVVVPAARRLLAERVRPPLRAHLGGVAAIATALQENALAATRQAELLVVPILIVVLLLVFRTPLAAAVPLLMGAATVTAGRGLLFLSTYAMPVNSLAVAIASMMGLALGVDYALLMVSRFRQERDGGADVEAALALAAWAAGRTIVFAGGTLAVAMVAAAFVAPGDLLSSVAAGVVVAALLSVLLAISLMPALLRVLAPYLERWRMPSARRGAGLLDVAGRLVARPWIAIPLIMLPMIAIAAPASALTIGPPDPRQLPPGDPTRQGFEALRRTLGPGWAAPVVVAATARKGPISTPGRLATISRWQDRVARDPAVEAVIGPASLLEAEGPVDRLRGAYRRAPSRLARAGRGIASLRSGLRRAGAGVTTLRAGLGSAAQAAARIGAGSHEAQGGAARLDAGLARAGAGAQRLSAGLDRALGGAKRLTAGQRHLGRGAARLAAGVERLDAQLQASLGPLQAGAARLRSWSAWLRSLRVPAELATERLERAERELEAMAVGSEDPRYAQLLETVHEAATLIDVPDRLARSLDSLATLPERLDRLAAGVSQLRAGTDRLAAGARRSAGGGRRLRAALQRLDGGGQRLDRGLEGAGRRGQGLVAGLATLGSGADRLATRLGAGQRRSAALASGLARPQGPLRHYAMVLHSYRRGYERIEARTPGAVDSGYLLLTALDGTAPRTREQVSQLVNVDRGGQTVRMMVVPRAGPSAPSTVALTGRLERALPALAKASHAQVAIGEGAESLANYTDATVARIPWLVAALSLVAVLMLTVVVRSLLLPLVAVALNLLTIAAAFGALELFFGFDLLVGPRYIDAISAAGVMTIMFVLSIDYEVFLLTRIRESWLRTHDHRLAIAEGLRHTAGIITGAATIMSSVFLAFATAQIASLQQFGAGLTFAVILDATVIRVVLLPAIMRALGPRAWWLPAWMDRRLPQLDADL